MVKIKLIKTSIIFCVALTCAACMSTQELSTNDKITTNRIEDLYQELQEWKEFQPTIVRLAELEQDLSFMLKEVKSANTFSSTDDQLLLDSDVKQGFTEFTEEVLVGLDNSNQEQMNPSDTNAPTKFSSNSPKVLTEKAQPVMGNNTVTDASIDNKFSGLTQVNNQVTTFKDAFEPKSEDENSSECFDFSGSYGLHLVSYLNEKHILNGWKKLKTTVDPLTCGREPLVNRVVVNDQTYFSLRVGPYQTKAQARMTCEKVKIQGLYCGVAEYTGLKI